MKSDFASILSQLRRERGLNQREVSQDLGISQALLSHYENGVREPRFEFVLKVCSYYNVTADYILGRTGASQPSGNPLSRYSNYSEAESAFLSAVSQRGDDRIALAAAGCAAAFLKRTANLITDPSAPYDPAALADEKLAEAALLLALKENME